MRTRQCTIATRRCVSATQRLGIVHVVTRLLPNRGRRRMARHGDVRSLNGSSITVPRRGPAGPSVQKKIYLIDVTGATDVSDPAKS